MVEKFTGLMAALQIGFLIGDQADQRLKVFVVYTAFQFSGGGLLFLMSFVGLFKLVLIDNTASEGIFAADHHRAAFFLVGQEHVAAG